MPTTYIQCLAAPQAKMHVRRMAAASGPRRGDRAVEFKHSDRLLDSTIEVEQMSWVRRPGLCESRPASLSSSLHGGKLVSGPSNFCLFQLPASQLRRRVPSHPRASLLSFHGTKKSCVLGSSLSPFSVPTCSTPSPALTEVCSDPPLFVRPLPTSSL